MRLAAIKMQSEEEESAGTEEEGIATSAEIIASTLVLVKNYRQILGENHLAHFLHGVIYVLQDEYVLGRECL